MKAFHEIAIPHKDIQEGKFTEEVYAAKLWDVYKNTGPDEYKDPIEFFKKTYITSNFQRIIDDVKERLDGKGGNHLKHIETPFGGGKTHTLIALLHKCKEWKVKPVVIVGTEMDPTKETMWGMIEEQLDGKITTLSGNVSHGSNALRKLLEKHQPVLILIDELSEYVGRAKGVKVEESTLASQTIGFVQELGEAISSLPRVCVVETLPSSTNEQIDNEASADLLDKLRKVSGRTEEKIMPINPKDVPNIIRRRLFKNTDDEINDRAESIVDDFVDYCADEGILPEGMQKSEYRNKFLNSYPFLPQVIDVLYERWGTITKFQRTRGVLRLLSLVVSSLSSSDKPFISLADFDLENPKIRRELVDLTDEQFESVIQKDITGPDSGASDVNKLVPDQYRGKKLGTRTATAIFMYSFSGKAGTNGATESEIKRVIGSRGIPASQITEVINLFKDHLFYLNSRENKLLFTKEANMLKMKIDMMEHLKGDIVDQAEHDLIEKNIGTQKLKVKIWPRNSKDVENSPSLKLIILKESDVKLMQSIFDNLGENPRVYRNNLFFLCPSEGERKQFFNSLKSKIAWEQIRDDALISLKEEQLKILDAELKKENNKLIGLVKKYYRTLFVPTKNGLESIQLGIPTVGDKGIVDDIYEHLLDEDEITEKLGGGFLKNMYRLEENKHVETSNLYESMLRTPGERRPMNRLVIEEAIRNGVLNGMFGLGELVNGKPLSRFFKVDPLITFDPGEVIIDANLCHPPETEFECTVCHYKTKDQVQFEEHKKSHVVQPPGVGGDGHPQDEKQLSFWFTIPEGQVNHVSPILLNIKNRFQNLKLRIDATEGSMSKNEIEKIKDALRQIGANSDLL